MASTQTTVTDFLNAAATDILALSPGQSLPGTQLLVWLNAFNAMVRNASADRLFLFYVPDVTYVGGGVSKESYEIGPGAADFDTDGGGGYTRPVFVESVRTKVGNNRRWKLGMNTEQEFAASNLRGVTDPDGPLDFNYGADIKVGLFKFAPALLANQTFYVSQWNPLKVFLQTELALIMEDYYPDEYITALRGALAIDRAGAYKRQVPTELAATTKNAVDTIKAMNNTRLGGSRTAPAPAVGIGQQIPQQGQ